MNSKRSLAVGMVLVLLAAASRLIPHPMNFAPITAIALFGGFYFDRRFAPVLPLAALVLSDAVLGFYDGILWVYGSFLLVTGIGMAAQAKRSVGVVAGSTLAGSVLFFIVTNFGVWQSGLLYPMTTQGLVDCYIAAVPFFRNALAGDVVYVTALFGLYEVAKRYVPGLRTTHA
ncbi:MAG: hypothetical protein F9K22_03260 [Bacteroidetes bacterium]|nr:MAG: hypothetical protein F9K22_03260 [Bacteroidota bacterium]